MRDTHAANTAEIAAAQESTATETTPGSPAYMAPEARRGEAGAAADQYSLGCLAYELLSGRRPLDPEIADNAAVALSGRPPPLSQVVPQVTAYVAHAIDVALARNPTDRHADVRAFVAATRLAADEFDASKRIYEVVKETLAPKKAVQRLREEQGLSPERAEQILDPTAQSLQRRTNARRRLLNQTVSLGAKRPLSGGPPSLLRVPVRAGFGFVRLTFRSTSARVNTLRMVRESGPLSEAFTRSLSRACALV